MKRRRRRKQKRKTTRRCPRGGVLPLVAAGVGALLGGVAAVKRNNARISARHHKGYDMVARI